jgi:hypothetical protein
MMTQAQQRPSFVVSVFQPFISIVFDDVGVYLPQVRIHIPRISIVWDIGVGFSVGTLR